MRESLTSQRRAIKPSRQEIPVRTRISRDAPGDSLRRMGAFPNVSSSCVRESSHVGIRQLERASATRAQSGKRLPSLLAPAEVDQMRQGWS